MSLGKILIIENVMWLLLALAENSHWMLTNCAAYDHVGDAFVVSRLQVSFVNVRNCRKNHTQSDFVKLFRA